jgi:hypothetical protein
MYCGDQVSFQEHLKSFLRKSLIQIVVAVAIFVNVFILVDRIVRLMPVLLLAETELL